MKDQTSKIESSVNIDKVIKILVVGNPKCGKTSIIGRYVSKSFDSKYKTTVGADYIRKDLTLHLKSGKRLGIRLQLWDIAGQDRFQKLTRAYFNRAKGVVIVCDVSRDGTVEAVRNWKKEIDIWAHQNDTPNIPVVLFANKADLLTNPQDSFVTGATMEKMCREENILSWWITSALTGECLDEGFELLLHKIIDMDPEPLFDDNTKDNGNKQIDFFHKHSYIISILLAIVSILIVFIIWLKNNWIVSFQHVTR